MENLVSSFNNIYQNKRVLVTGHTGFKGGWLSLWLHALGAEVMGYSLAPQPGDNFFSILPENCFTRSTMGDLRDPVTLNQVVAGSRADVIFHLAAQPIVGLSYREPVDTFTTNALGTALLLEAVRQAGSKAAVVIVTSDKCYRNDNSGRPFIESDPLGGHDVYSMSKAATEMVVSAWHASFFSKNPALGALATGRAGNVVGGGDYAEDRIIPDAVRAYENKQPLVLRRPQATRPWQHVLESVSGYLTLGQQLMTQQDSSRLLNYNFGPDFEAERSVQELLDAWLSEWQDAFELQITPQPHYEEAVRLSLDPSRAKQELGWAPVWNFHDTIAHTVAWYRLRHESRLDNAAMLAFSLEQIAAYTGQARRAGVSWTN